MFKAIEEDTGKRHHALDQRPSLRPDCIKYYDAFEFLSDFRMWTEAGPNPIQVSEIESYCRMTGIESGATQMKYARLIRKMDSLVIEHIFKQRKAASK